MKHAVQASDVGRNHSRLMNLDFVSVDFHIDPLPVHRRRGSQLDRIHRHQLPRNHMVSQHRDQLLLNLPFEECVDGTVGQRGERFVRRNEHCEGALTDSIERIF